MQFYQQETGFVDNTALWTKIALHLSTNGFDLISVDGNTSSPNLTGSSMSSCVLEATTSVDPIADVQPWRIKIQCTADTARVWCATPSQISDTGTVTVMGENYQSGELAVGTGAEAGTAYTLADTPPDDGYNKEFSSRFRNGLSEADYGAFPSSFHVSVTDHGIAVMTWVEGKDNSGSCFSWFVVQRPVDKTGAIVVTGKAPLFCVYSVNGGGSANLNSTSAGGILKYVVREDDVHMPTWPISAVANMADSEALINPIQQVSITEDEEFVASFPNNLTTQRYKYPYELDLLCTTSADVISQFNETDISQYGEGVKRKFKAMNANHSNNKGMRVLFLIEDNKAAV